MVSVYDSSARLDGLPSMRQQLITLTRPLRRQPRENVLQISIRFMPIQPRSLDQTHDRTCLISKTC